ncbi:hypothetical protein B0H11DRAFT_1985061 [Mycena galericulata]|nr:hypothetical protein B0H11DRAFT_1985061 [Mycena galericulata]
MDMPIARIYADAHKDSESTTMQRLPYELLDIICSLLDTKDIWALTQVSSYFRANAIFPLLSRYGISESDVRSGILSLSHSFFLISLISWFRPICKLVCFERDEGGGYGQEDLIAVLGAAAPIPDILIHDRYDLSKNPQRAANLLWSLPQTRYNTLLLVKHGSISVSRPRVAQLHWRSMWPHMVSRSPKVSGSLHRIMCIAVRCVKSLVSGIFNLGGILAWIRRRTQAVGFRFDQRSRIEHAIRPLYPGHWMRIDTTFRIQTVPAKVEDFTLVTIAGELSRQMRIPYIPALDKDVYAAMLASLDLSDHLVHLTIEKHCNLAQAGVMTFLQRHPNLETISFEPGSLDVVDELLIEKDAPRIQYCSKVHTLSAPAACIPSLVSAAPNVVRISITVEASKNAEALPEYRLALLSVASLPGTEPLVLSLMFDLAASQLPWHHPPAEGEKSAEAQLVRVKELVLAARRPLKFSGAAIRWLGSFPSMERVVFVNRCLVPMTTNERSVFAAAIRETCPGSNLSVVFAESGGVGLQKT